MEHNRLKAKEDLLYYTQEIVQALAEDDLTRLAKAREEILKNGDIVFKTEEEKLNIYRIVVASYNGAYNQGEALPIAKKIVKITRNIYPKNSPEQMEAYDMLAYVSLAAGECEDAMKLASELRRYYTKKMGKEDKKTIKVTALLGRCQWKMGDYRKAYDKLMEAFRMSESAYGPMDSDTLNYRRELAMCQFYLGNIQAAYQNMMKTYDICLQKYGEYHTVTLKTSQNLLEIAKEYQKS